MKGEKIMLKQRKFLWMVIFGFVSLIMLAACGSDANSNGKNNNDNNNNDPVNNLVVNNDNNNQDMEEDIIPEDIELNFFYPDEWVEELFVEQIKEPIEEAFSHITLNYVGVNQPLEEYIANGVFPDIIFLGNPSGMQNYIDHELTMDQTELMEKHGFDLDRIESSLVAESRLFAQGNLYTIPYTRGATVTHYNKEIFDLFGVDYLTDDMTWDEVIDVALKLTGEVDGTQYIGMQVPYASIMLDQRGILKVDPETDEPLYMSDEYMPLYQKYLEKMDRIYSNIPGAIPEEGDDRDPSVGPFMEDRNVAINPIWSQVPEFSKDEKFDFDIVTYPVWDDMPNTSRPSRSGNIGVAATSEHPDEAFKALAHLFTDEVQAFVASQGRASVLVDQSINDEHYLRELVEERPWMEDMNLSAHTKHGYPTNVDVMSDFEEFGYAPLEERLLDGDDINTILREAQEHAKASIEDAMGKDASSEGGGP